MQQSSQGGAVARCSLTAKIDVFLLWRMEEGEEEKNWEWVYKWALLMLVFFLKNQNSWIIMFIYSFLSFTPQLLINHKITSVSVNIFAVSYMHKYTSPLPPA